MKFIIEQIAIVPPKPRAAEALLFSLGATEWAKDHVKAMGRVFCIQASNEADLAFNYQLARSDGKPLEFEVLQYTDGENWMDTQKLTGVSHLGMHCSEEQLDEFRAFFKKAGIEVAQEVNTMDHSNPAIRGLRWYTYVIFDTRSILGVDLKFIVRREHA